VADSFVAGLLDHPHYTRPEVLSDAGGERKVPEALLSGDHARIERWRRRQSLLRTWRRRPDLLPTAPLSETDRKFLKELETSGIPDDL
jgi:tRNA (guanine37-N1)-methyltransferase